MRLGSFIIVLVLATLLGIYIRQEPGYALFAYKDWTMEMPLWVAFILFLLTVFIFLFILWFIFSLLSGKRTLKEWWGRRRQKKARLHTSQGLLELAEGQWLKAERNLSRAARFSDAPLINYLSAAKAAEQRGSYDQRDKYLQLAYDVSGGSDIAVKLTEAQFRFNHGELEQSVATLQQLHHDQPKNPRVLKLLCTIYEATQDWKSLFYILPDLHKAGIFQKKEDEDRLEQKVVSALLPLAANEGKNALIKFWSHASNSIHSNPSCIVLYTKQLIALGDNSEAETVLRNALKKQWDKEMIHLYGAIKGPNLKKQLNFAEGFLEGHSNDPALLLTLGRLCLEMQLWGKSRDYLEKAVAMEPTAEGFALLAQLMDKMGFPLKRDEYYKKGLYCATGIS